MSRDTRNSSDVFSDSNSFEDIDSGCREKFFLTRMFGFLKYSKRFLPSIVTLLLSLILGTVGFVFVWLDKTLDSVNYVKDDINASVVPEFDNSTKKSEFLRDSRILNLLILGIDGHEKNERGRSDSIILMSIDSNHKKIKLSSFMRDLYVEIPGHSFDKLNHAFVYGGAPLTAQTLEKNFKISIDKYIEVDFDSFKDIIEALDGIDMELDSAEAAYINKWSRDDRYLEVSSGIKHLLAPHALCHARNRSTAGSDFERIKRQRDIVRACFSKLKTSNLITIADVISKAGPKITTNFQKSEIMKISPSIVEFLGYELKEYSVPEPEDYINSTKKGMSVLKIKESKKTCYKLAKFIYEDAELVDNK